MPAKLSWMLPISGWWSRRTLAQRFTTLTAVLIAGSAIIQGAVLVGVASHVVTRLASERVEQRLDKAAALLSRRIAEFRKMPLILSGTPPIARIAALSTGATPQPGESLEIWLQRLEIIFRSIVQAYPTITQARFIGVTDGGRELARVNRVGDTIEIVEKANLQRKGNSHYFKQTSKLRAGEIYISPVDVNVENDIAVRPYEPTIRSATPIFTEQGALFGMIVVNASPHGWLRDIADLSRPAGRFFAANQDGDYIFRSDGGPIFGSLEGSPARFKQDWPQISGVFNPSAPGRQTARGGGQFLADQRVDYNPETPNEFVVLAADVDANAVFGDTWRLIMLGAAVALAMALIGVMAAYFVSRPLKGLMSAAKQISEGKLDITALGEKGAEVEIGELGAALRIMEDAVESRDASLRKSEAQLQAIVDNTIDGLITIDRKGIILRYNRGCEDIFGYTIDEAVGKNVSILMPRPNSKTTDSYPDWDESTGAPFVGKRSEVRGRHKSGRLIDIEIAIAEINVGEEVLFSGIVQDVTERKKTERIKSEFVSTVSHELRTPLTSLMGSLGLLSSGALGALPDKAGRMIMLAQDNGARLVNLINDILDIDKIEAGHIALRPVRTNLRALIERAAELSAAFARQHGASSVLQTCPRDIFVDTDPDRFLQVLDNLLSNAAKFSPRAEKSRSRPL